MDLLTYSTVVITDHWSKQAAVMCCHWQKRDNWQPKVNLLLT